VYEVAGPKRIPIIGQGGIASVQDALEFIVAGATAVGLGTALFYEPLLCQTINAGLAHHLAAQRLESIAQLVGTLATGARATAAAPC
jgi:dihydroorotate dehydrogenase (NAD+) catalytic subunit